VGDNGRMNREPDGAAEAALSRLAASLERSRARLAVLARPTAGDLSAVVREIEDARRDVERVYGGGALKALSESQRVSLIRAARGVRARLAILARLVHGGARFAALVREMDPADRSPVIYGRHGGERPSAVPGRIERRA